MARIFEFIGPDLQAWISRQKVFFVATAPLSAQGHVNCSPKGGDTFRIIDATTVAYLDLTGSGIETIAHIQENKRIVIMFCAFEGSPQIVRLHGTAEVLYPNAPEFPRLCTQFPDNPGARAIIKVQVTRISDSCGYGVPLLEFRGERKVLDDWATKKEQRGLVDYRKNKNRASIDGIAGYLDPNDKG